MKKALKYGISGLFLITTLIFIAVYILISSENFTRWLVNNAAHSIPGKLHYAKLKGQLNRTIILTNVIYEDNDKSFVLSSDKMTACWNLKALLRGKLSLRDINIDTLKIKLNHANSNKPINKTSLALPGYKIHIKNSEINHLTLESSAYGTPIILENIRFNAKIYPELLSIQLITRMTSPTPMHVRLETSGKPINYLFTVVVDQETNHWSLQGEGDTHQLKFHTMENKILGGTFKLLGQLNFGEKLNWFADMEIKEINPEPFFPLWPGKINFMLATRVDNDTTIVDLAHLNGTLKNQTLLGEFHYRQSADHNHFINSDLHFGNAHFKANGKINHLIDLQWDLNIPNLHTLLAEYGFSGSLASQGSLNGPREMPNVQINAQGQNLQFDQWFINQLNLHALYRNDNAPMSLQFDFNKIQHDKKNVGDLHGSLTGTMAQNTIHLMYGLEKNLVKLNAKGQYSDQQWQGTLDNISIQSPSAHNWHLNSPTPLSLSKDSVHISPFCLLNDKVKFCMNSQWQKGKTFTADIKSEKIPLDIFNPWLGDFILHGEVNATTKITALPNKTPTVDLNIELLPGVFDYFVDDISRPFHYQGGIIKAQLNEHQFSTKIALELLQKSTVTANIIADPKRWNPNNWLASPIRGDFALNAPQLDFLAALIPKIAKTRGSGIGHGNISGTIAHPVLTGTAKVTHASFGVPDVSGEIKNLTATGAIREGVLSYQGIGSAGEGNFKITGTTQIKNKQLHTHLELQGKNMLISDTPGVKVVATPNLKMNIVDKVMSLEGNLFIPKGEFRSYDYNDTLELPDEISYRQKPLLKPSAAEPVQLTTYIELKLGNNITIDSNGLKGKLVGGLTINDKAGGATTAFGQLSLQNGTYDFRGQPLKVDRGILNFNGGPIENPNLTARAIRRIGMGGIYQSLNLSDQNRVVGINITGTLAKHTLTLFSEPDDITTSDILSYLVLGQSTTAVSGSSMNAKALLGAAQALNLSGDNSLSRFKSQLEQKLGLSELDITSYETKNKASPETTIQHTAFVLGRYLSPKLYVNYSFDILDHTNVFRIRYFLNKKWSVQSESSVDGNGLDILYSFERG
ncbi:MAG: translocation/assembly module TamB domain-containing protein [Gammaproteobacteria bacterium]|nr:translocation/assembly module TamB domain-containing protein [Gammaproteobacteria bacterium]